MKLKYVWILGLLGLCSCSVVDDKPIPEPPASVYGNRVRPPLEFQAPDINKFEGELKAIAETGCGTGGIVVNVGFNLSWVGAPPADLPVQNIDGNIYIDGTRVSQAQYDVYNNFDSNEQRWEYINRIEIVEFIKEHKLIDDHKALDEYLRTEHYLTIYVDKCDLLKLTEMPRVMAVFLPPVYVDDVLNG